jgi:WD40 repeat protein
MLRQGICVGHWCVHSFIVHVNLFASATMLRCVWIDEARAGSTRGDIAGHGKKVLSCDLRPVKPYRVVSASEDMQVRRLPSMRQCPLPDVLSVLSLVCSTLALLAAQVNLYEGPPFKFVKSMREHTKFANCARFSPDGALLCTVGSDMKVVIYDAASGEKKGGSDSWHAACMGAGRIEKSIQTQRHGRQWRERQKIPVKKDRSGDRQSRSERWVCLSRGGVGRQ